MHHRNVEEAHIWMDAAGRELVSRLSPRRPTQDDIHQAMCCARRTRARHFRRNMYRWCQALRHLLISAYKG